MYSDLFLTDTRAKGCTCCPICNKWGMNTGKRIGKKVVTFNFLLRIVVVVATTGRCAHASFIKVQFLCT
jgi:hypothetical protein